MIAKLAIGACFLVLLAFGALVGVLYYYQRSMVFPVPALDESVPEGFEAIRYQTSDALELRAGYRPALEGMPTLLFFHGNGVDWQTTFHTTLVLAARGYGVLAAEYRGYGGNAGEPSEDGLYRDGQAAFDWLIARGIAAGDIVLAGNSLGSGVATELARQTDVRALVLVAPFKSMTATASYAYPWAPVGLLLLDRFENIAKIGEVTSPVLVVHGENDALIPIAHARQLAAANERAQFVTLAGFGHNMSGEAAAQLPQLQFLEALPEALSEAGEQPLNEQMVNAGAR